MDKPSEKNLSKMRTYAEKFAEKSGTYLHPDHSVTDVVVEGLARHIEEVGKPLCPCNFYPDKAAEASCVAGSVPAMRCKSTNTAIVCCL